jgi:hypothetical protein
VKLVVLAPSSKDFTNHFNELGVTFTFVSHQGHNAQEIRISNKQWHCQKQHFDNATLPHLV